MRIMVLFLSFSFLHVSVEAADSWAATSNSLFTEEQLENRKNTKNIYAGDTEFEGGLKMQSGGFGSYIDSNIHARYFLIDKISMGLTMGYTENILFRKLRIGPSFRAYIAEFGKFALSLNQKLFWEQARAKRVGFYRPRRSESFHGATGLGLHYFITPEVSLGLTFNGNYQFSGNNETKFQGFDTLFGITISF